MCGEVFDRLNARLPEMRHDEWDDEIRALKENYPLKYDHSVLTGPYVVEEIDRVRQRVMRSSLPRSDSIRCGLHSIINI